MAFVQRTSRYDPTPLATSSWYVSTGNVFYPNYYFLPPNGNCTWYAYGRYAEIRGNFANLPTGNAGTWFENATSFNRGVFSQGAQPQLGAIICFKSLSGTHLGHLTVVEQINSDGSIVISNSGYQSNPSPTNDTYFWRATVRRENGYMENWYTSGGRDYYCQGFIYNDTEPVPPPGPPPYVNKQMPLWFYLRRF